MWTADQLLKVAEAYGASQDRGLATVGRRACGNDKIFQTLKRRKGCNILTAAIAQNWFVANWPDGVPWPEGVPRMSCEQAAA